MREKQWKHLKAFYCPEYFARVQKIHLHIKYLCTYLVELDSVSIAMYLTMTYPILTQKISRVAGLR